METRLFVIVCPQCQRRLLLSKETLGRVNEQRVIQLEYQFESSEWSAHGTYPQIEL